MKKFHLSINVTDLDKSVAFYRSVLGVAPAKHFPDYAKFELTEPPLVLSLEPGRAADGQKLNHLGLRVETPAHLQEAAMRAGEAGLAPQYLEGIECCYSRQTKICFNDPDENMVEFYILEEELDKKSESAAASAKTTPSAAGAVVWDHMLGTPFPAHIPLADATADEVRLRGTFNLRFTPADRAATLAEVSRVLKPGGKLLLHLLVADKEVEKQLPRLPGPAALVEYAPVAEKLVDELGRAGFQGVYLKRFSHSAVFQFDGAEMREMMATAAKPGVDSRAAEGRVVYKGPFPSITDEAGRTYRRGEPVVVSGETHGLLAAEGFAEHFVFLNEPSPGACGTA